MPLAFTRRLRSRLVLRIYLAGLAQVAAVILGFFLIMRVDRPPFPPGEERKARFVVDGIVAKLGDDAALERELDRVRDMLDVMIVVHDDEGRVLAETRRAPPAEREREPRGTPPELGRRRRPPPHRPRELTIPVRLPDGRAGRVAYVFQDRGGPPGPHDGVIIALTLVVVGVASLLTARSLARPLARLARAARAFGTGQLDARVGLARSDEIGEVAATFDEMASRVTDLLRAEKELLANVSHELRTPLARIRVALDLAAEGDADVARESLGEIAEDLNELEQLINDVLTAARLDLASGSLSTGMPPLRRERIDARELLERAASRFRSAHPDRALLVELEPDLPALTGDPVLLRRAVDNLLENAHKYSHREGEGVELRAQAKSAELWIEVRDRGIGIAPEDLPRVFQPFFRADRSRTRATGGLGLGLALTKRIVEAHHGTIEIESMLSEGTRAHVRLPSAPALDT